MRAWPLLPILAILGTWSARGSDEPWSFVPAARDAPGVGALVEPRQIGPENVLLVGSPSSKPDKADPRRTVLVHFDEDPKPAQAHGEIPEGARWPGPDGRMSIATPQGTGAAEGRNPWTARSEAAGGPRQLSFRCGGVIAGGQGAAFLNGKIVHIADLLSGYRVARIVDAGTVVERNGFFYVLPAGRTTVLTDTGE